MQSVTELFLKNVHPYKRNETKIEKVTIFYLLSNTKSKDDQKVSKYSIARE